MNKKALAISAAILFATSLLVFSLLDGAATVFSDNFSSGGFASWSRTFSSPGSSQTVSGGTARFVVPTPPGGNVTFSYLVRDGFTSTVNSTIVASQDILVNKVPFGCSQGMGAIFFLYVCDSRDLGGNYGNVGVGIDGCGLWSMWIGGNSVYTYVFQTAGAAPSSNTWYHLTLALDNSAATATLTVDDATVIIANQSQFTDATHTISLMTGMGENWWSQGSGQQEIDISNVKLHISDIAATVTNPPATHTPSFSSSPETPTLTPHQTSTPTAAPSTSTTSFPPPSASASSQPTSMQETKQDSFSWWIILPLIVTVMVCVEILFMLKKR
jgi:hypothetical protein